MPIKATIIVCCVMTLGVEAYEFAGRSIIGCLTSSTSAKGCNKSAVTQSIPYDLAIACSDETAQRDDDNSLKKIVYQFSSIQDMLDDFAHQDILAKECQCSCNFDGQEVIPSFERGEEIDFKIQEGAVNAYLQAQKKALTKTENTPVGDITLEPTELTVDFQSDGLVLKMTVKVSVGAVYVGTRTFEKSVSNATLLVKHTDDQLVLDMHNELGEQFDEIETWADSKISFYGSAAQREFCTVPNTLCYQVSAVESALHYAVNKAFNKVAIMSQDYTANVVGVLTEDQLINPLITLKGSVVLSAYSLGELNVKMFANLIIKEPMIEIVYDKSYPSPVDKFFLVRVVSNVPLHIGQIELGDFGRTPCLELYATDDTRDFSRCKQLSVKKVGDEYVLLVVIKGGQSLSTALPVINKSGYLEFTNVPDAITAGPFEFRVRAEYQGNYISAIKVIDLGRGL